MESSEESRVGILSWRWHQALGHPETITANPVRQRALGKDLQLGLEQGSEWPTSHFRSGTKPNQLVKVSQSAGEVCFNQTECCVSAYRMVIPATLKFDYDIDSWCYATLHPSLSIFKPKYLTIFTEDQTQSGSDKHGLRCNPSRYLPNYSARRLLIADIFFLGLLCQVPRHFHSHRKARPVAEDGRAGLEGQVHAVRWRTCNGHRAAGKEYFWRNKLVNELCTVLLLSW